LYVNVLENALREPQKAKDLYLTISHRITTSGTVHSFQKARGDVMAGCRQRNNGSWEFVFKRKGLLPEPVYFTFDTKEEGDRYAQRAEEQLAKGIVPIEMQGGKVQTLDALCEMYEANVVMARSEAQLLPTIAKDVQGVRLSAFNYGWVERYVEGFKHAGRAPSTITKRISGLARVVDWAMRREMLTLPQNPLRLLPKGYGSKGFDRNKLWSGERDRRLEASEEGAIRSVLADKNEALLFDMALETAMRLGEMFTLKTADVDLGKRTIFLHRTKNGTRRQVPISSVLLKLLQSWDMSKEHLFQDWWQGGDQTQKEKVGHMLSHRFAARFEKAGCPDLRLHDLRHESTSRLYERTGLSDLEIASITGHKGFRMLQRYANLRGSNLAVKLW
jgi:integrase